MNRDHLQRNAVERAQCLLLIIFVIFEGPARPDIVVREHLFPLACLPAGYELRDRFQQLVMFNKA